VVTLTLIERPLLELTGDVLDECGGCTWWVRVDELDVRKRCTWCRGTVLDARG
jgi:hypothetical protein